MTRRNPNHLSARYDGAWDTHRRHETKANWIYFRREPPSIGNRDTTVPVTQCNRPCHVTANFLGAFEGDALGLALTALADTPPSDHAGFRLHGALLALLRAYLPTRTASCVGRRVMSLCSRKDLARAGLSLCGFLTCNVLLPSLLRTNSTGSRGLISPHGAGSSRFWRTRHSTRTRRDGSRG